MIDIHTHILPNIDDGADAMSVSAELLRLSADQGVKEIVFTPHYYGKNTVEEFLAERNAAMQSIRELVPAGLKTRMGAEVLMTGVNDPSDEQLCALAIEGTKCVLVEFPYAGKLSQRLFDRLADFVSETGYSPIVAHIERYDEVLQNPAIASWLAKIGCFIQVNTSAFLEKHSRRFAFALLKHGLVHCVGTDAHDTGLRTSDYAEAQAAILKKGFADEWTEIQWCMGRMLAGEAVLKPYGQVRKIGKFYF